MARLLPCNLGTIQIPYIKDMSSLEASKEFLFCLSQKEEKNDKTSQAFLKHFLLVKANVLYHLFTVFEKKILFSQINDYMV